MKGLLHRLAAQATGTTATVRSDARLGFLGATVPSAPDAVSPSLVFKRRRAAPSPPLTSQPDDAPHDHAPAAIAEPAPARREPRHVESAPWSDMTTIGESQATPSNPALFNPPATVPARLLDVFVDDTGPDPPRAGLEIDSPRRSADQRAREGERRDAAVRIVREPPALLPLTVSDRAPLAAPAGVLTRMPGVAPHIPDRSDRSDVHIHIGCVEVTAVHEPAAPRRRPAPAQPPMSLDTYFAKRRRP